MSDYPYVTRLDIKFDQLEVVDVLGIIAECRDKWFNQTLTRFNDSVIRLGIVEGEYHWHKHDDDDEFFFVLDGCLMVDIEQKTFELHKFEGITVPKGILHRTRANEKTIMLMAESYKIVPTGDGSSTL